tara:strand:+ start:414 stop:716 length:303 start_codon:yes stop_codon:yes gene_type:complete
MLSDEAKIIRFKNQRNNMEIKLNEKVDELQKLNDNYMSLQERHKILEKNYSESCHERNKCEILIEKKNNFRMEEYKKYKEFYNNYVPYTDELQKLLIKKQ